MSQFWLCKREEKTNKIRDTTNQIILVKDKREKEVSMAIQSPTEQEEEEKVTNYDPLNSQDFES